SLPNNPSTANARQGQYQQMTKIPAPINHTDQRPLKRQNAVNGGLNRNTGGYQPLPNNSQTAGARQGQYQSLPNNPSTANARQGQYQSFPQNQYDRVNQPLNASNGTTPTRNQYEKPASPIGNSNGTAPQRPIYDKVPPQSQYGAGPSARPIYDKVPPQSQYGAGPPEKPKYDKVPPEKNKQLNRTKAVKTGLSDQVKKSNAKTNSNKKGSGTKVNPNKKRSNSVPKKLPKRKGKF
ncbi:MAG: hypothetical protein AAGK97_17945, partial [Bacteroidota bacterium]